MNAHQKINVLNLVCPGCGAGLQPADKYCNFCSRPVVIRSFTSVFDVSPQELNKLAAASKKYGEDHPGDHEISRIHFTAAACYLRLKLYDKASERFEIAIEDNFDYADTYFYAAICLLRGKRPFLALMNDIKKMIDFLTVAISIEPKGIYYYLLGYIKQDFYERKYLRISPSSADEYANASACNVSPEDIRMLGELVNQSFD